MTVGPHTLTNATATATDANGNTSEFSGAVAWPANTDGDGVPDSIWVDLGYPPVKMRDGRLRGAGRSA